jgi:hypothetical protein
MKWSLAPVAMVMASSVMAAPGDLAALGSDAVESLAILDVAEVKGCAGREAGVCFAAGGRSTIAVESGAVALAAPRGKKQAPPVIVPRFARATSLAGTTITGPSAGGSWTLEVLAALKKPALAGNAIFMLFDSDDPEALAARQFTALYQANVKAGAKVGARLVLSPEEGFRAGHTYKLRIMQLVSGREILLAEGDVTLL